MPNDGWYDDTGGGPVMARLVMFSEEVQKLRYVDVEYPAWVPTASSILCARNPHHHYHGKGGREHVRSGNGL